MSALTPFTYDSRNIRVIERDGEAWFVAADCLPFSMEASRLARHADIDRREAAARAHANAH